MYIHIGRRSQPFVFKGELQIEIEGQHTKTTTSTAYLAYPGK